MQLTLEVISANGDLLGSNRRKTVGAEGAQIGRSKESDWVINDQYISRIHARVRCVNGAFYVEGLGRNPLSINDPEQTIPNNEPHLLRNGDRFFLDQYEIRATVSSGAAGMAPTIPDDPFAPSPPASTRGGVPQSWGNDGLNLGIADGTQEEAANLDPLAALGGSPAKSPAPPIPVNLNQGSVLENSFTAPTPIVQAPPTPRPGTAGGGSRIPESWEHSSGFTQMGQQPPAAAAPSVRRPVPPAAPRPISPAESARTKALRDDSIPDAWDKSRTRIEVTPPSPKASPFGDLVQDADAPRIAQTPHQPQVDTVPQAPRTIRRPDVSVAAQPPAAKVAPAARPHVETPRSHAGSTAGGSLELEEILRAAGVPASQMSPEMARELGQVLRIVVQGLMEVLQSRAEIKSQLRMSMTRMQPTENNPLKFSPNVEAALHTLLVERNRGYLPTVRAFQEALTDVRNHQIAVLQGIRTAFNSMLEQFDPEKIDAELEKPSKRGGLLNIGGKGGKFREQYVEQYESMTRDPDEAFKRLFGEFFAQAYEEQMDRLKMTGRTVGDGQ
jgi:type VI secretion system protein ImpI